MANWIPREADITIHKGGRGQRYVIGRSANGTLWINFYLIAEEPPLRWGTKYGDPRHPVLKLADVKVLTEYAEEAGLIVVDMSK